jgi:prevent-host-death family protein
MRARSISVAQAKAHLPECVRAAERGRCLVITRHGRPVAAMVPVGAMAELERLRAARPGGGLGDLAGAWSDGDELAAEIDRGLAARRPPRAAPDLESG